ncbi:class I SAM-dependent methyltransferase [Oleispirillum naphthae]|uniref:class I SAM-dependent methyltransferase n=1 Tax=Oleispirillum naphthae TaxID=2838853 RepID=UPI00308228B3
MLFELFLRRLIRLGDLTVTRPDGSSFHIAGGPIAALPAADRPAPVHLRFSDPRVVRRLPWHPALAFGEGFMDGAITLEEGTLRDLVALFIINFERLQDSPRVRLSGVLARLVRRAHQNNPVKRSKANVAHHYDLPPELYDAFLDADRQYSCAYYPTGNETLEQAQAAKKRHIAAKLLLQPGQRVLDIGCGWGGMALTLAKDYGADVTGITLSEHQLAIARQRAEAAGLSDRVRFELVDYRQLKGRYDRIVSVGMFEHVGVRFYRTFFRAVREHLADDGVALLHTIGRSEPPGDTNAWIRKYIFPGGYIPALSEVMAAVERERLVLCDLEVLRLHYAETLKHWQDRFQRHRAEIAAMLDERFCRMWEFYLVGSEMSFRHENMVVFQLQLSRSKTAVPETRDYMCAFEASHPLPMP